MRPQTLTYKEGGKVIKLDDSNTFIVESNELQWGPLYPPTIIVEGIEEDRTKFDFYKAYKNGDDIVCHCEYRSSHGEKFKLIVHTL